MRILAKQLPKHVGQRVLVQGWLHKKRLLGGLTFIVVRDRSGLVQVLVKDKGEVEKLRGLQLGTILSIEGLVAADERAPGGVEIHEVGIKVDVPVAYESPIEIDKPLSHEPSNLDTLFDYRVIGLRNPRELAIFKVQAEIQEAIRSYLRSQDFTEFKSPKLLPGATEGGAEVFKLDYFGQEATLAQSPQFYKELMVGVFERAYEIANVYRAEPSATTRHMTEYTSIDAEMGFVTIEDLKKLLSGLMHAVVEHAWERCEAELNMWGATKPVLPSEIPSLSMAQIHELYSAATGENSVGEDDLRPDEERWICEYTRETMQSDAVFVTDWPAKDMKFYHKAQEGKPELADRFDLLFRGVEITTGSMRENRYDILVKQLQEMAGGNPEADGFKNFIMGFKYGMPPLGGFGMGLERLTQKMIGLANVKEATLFPRDINRLAP
ncbi:MAG TPA: aspartate--tRNA(Asn) ligase [Candidatus Saccharimonadales bacterium]|nr:aspartate--tRNA(Asn) ligase [Candidatus Saccharimonadales bacterium]